MPKTALIITHAAAIFDKSMSAKRNIEEFISLHPDIDVIRLKSPEHDDYIDAGEVIESDLGSLNNKEAKNIVSTYNRIITAGGYFNFCALRTYNSLLSAYFDNNENELEIVVPLSLLYTPETDFRNCEIYPKKSYTVEEVIRAYEGTNKGKMNRYFMQREINLKSSVLIAGLDQMDNFSFYIPEKELVTQTNGLKLVGLMSHNQLEQKWETKKH